MDEIAGRLASAEFGAADFLFDETANSWIPFLESKPLMDVIKARAPMAPPTDTRAQARPRTAASVQAPEPLAGGPGWVVKRGIRLLGPFTYGGLLRALQEKSVFEFDLVRQGEEAESGPWNRIAERDEFSAERLRELLQSGGLGDAFVMRRFPRRPIAQDALVHDNQKAWIGKTFEISEGGCGLVVRNALLAPGQVIHVHFGRGDGLPPYNAVCEVVSKRFVPDVRDSRTPIQYGVKYLQIDPKIVAAARDYANSNSNSNSNLKQG